MLVSASPLIYFQPNILFTFPFTLNLIAIILKHTITPKWSLLTPMLLSLQLRTCLNKLSEHKKLSSMCGEFLTANNFEVV